MLSEGEPAPRFELPALVDGERRRMALTEYLYEEVVILAFYPADFNPACDEESCDLDELDLFTMQKDVTILGISPDSVHSHRAFAEKYDLNVPLLADTDGSVAEKYDISLTDGIGQQLVERAVAVVNHDGEIQYAWSTEEMTELPRVEKIKDAIAETGGDDTAFARYRVGHAHYTEGRRAFTSAMNGFQASEWMMAQKDFQQAREEFEEAADQFDTAVRFVDDDAAEPIYEDSKTKATALWQAADWLTQSAKAYSSGSGAEGQELRDDAERPIESARGYAEPPDPDEEWPPDVEDLEKDDDEEHSILPTEDAPADTALDVDIDAEMGAEEELPLGNGTEQEPTPDDGTTDEPTEVVAESTGVAADEHGDMGADGGDNEGGTAEEDIDDEELAEIQAELEANSPAEEPSADEITEESTAIVDAPPMAESDSVDDEDDEMKERAREELAELRAELDADIPDDNE